MTSDQMRLDDMITITKYVNNYALCPGIINDSFVTHWKYNCIIDWEPQAICMHYKPERDNQTCFFFVDHSIETFHVYGSKFETEALFECSCKYANY